MRFLLDMGLASSTTRFLRELGHDAVHLREQGLQRLDDHFIIEKARYEKRVILTHDLDFSRIIALGGGKQPSVITFRLENMKPYSVNHFLGIVLEEFSDHVERGVLVSVNENSIRVRPLPVEPDYGPE